MIGELEAVFDQLEDKIDSMDAYEVRNRERKAVLEYERRKGRFVELLNKFQREVCTPLNCSYGIKLDDWTDITIHGGGVTVYITEYAGETLTLGGFYPKEKIRSERLSAEEFVRKHANGIYTMEEITRKLLGYIPTPQSWDGTGKAQPIF